LFREEVRAWLVRARRRGEKYDLIVLDPPTFASTEGKNSFRSVKDYAEVARDALCLLAPSGALLAVTNHRGTNQDELRRILRRAAGLANRRVTQLKDLASPLDCPKAYGEPHPSRSVLVRVA
jgi:23S rRNA (cytosine1962-C5)-methyltransferase